VDRVVSNNKIMISEILSLTHARTHARTHAYKHFLKSHSCDNFQIGPFFLPPRLTGEIYVDFLENELLAFLEDVPLREREELIFQHDGASAHFSL